MNRLPHLHLPGVADPVQYQASYGVALARQLAKPAPWVLRNGKVRKGHESSVTPLKELEQAKQSLSKPSPPWATLQSLQKCKAKFVNIHDFTGEPQIPVQRYPVYSIDEQEVVFDRKMAQKAAAELDENNTVQHLQLYGKFITEEAPWLAAINNRPGRPGVYPFKSTNDPYTYFRLWDGVNWCPGDRIPEFALRNAVYSNAAPLSTFMYWQNKLIIEYDPAPSQPGPTPPWAQAPAAAKKDESWHQAIAKTPERSTVYEIRIEGITDNRRKYYSLFRDGIWMRTTALIRDAYMLQKKSKDMYKPNAQWREIQ